ncbi:unnamed protein product [Meloidogyne enterolobii]|uniref:Uncharacterized protein n=1 Tax=Meloidogyne enterolobii TaxID=390850 RepID=A0ACB0YE19_MELEN
MKLHDKSTLYSIDFSSYSIDFNKFFANFAFSSHFSSNFSEISFLSFFKFSIVIFAFSNSSFKLCV